MHEHVDPGSADTAALEALSCLGGDTGRTSDGEASHLESITNHSDDQPRHSDPIVAGMSRIDIQHKQEPSDSKDRKHKIPFIEKAKKKWEARKNALLKGKGVEVSMRLGSSPYLRRSTYDNTESKARANDHKMPKSPPSRPNIRPV